MQIGTGKVLTTNGVMVADRNFIKTFAANRRDVSVGAAGSVTLAATTDIEVPGQA